MQKTDAFTELERGVYAALETYSNVHRGSGHNSMVTSNLYDQARDIILEYLGLSKKKYVVIFCTPRREAAFISQLQQESYLLMSSNEIGLALGVRALVVKRKALYKGILFETGGGTTSLISPEWAVWAKVPDRYEAGTPAIINIITFARALLMIKKYGKDIFRVSPAKKLSYDEILYRDELDIYSGRELLGQIRHTLLGLNLEVPTMEGKKPYINLDNSASTPTFKPVWNAVCQTWHQSGKLYEEIILEVKSICTDFLCASADTYDVIFTSNTTEAINIVAEDISHESCNNTETVILNTIAEHSSNDLPWRNVPDSSLIRLSIDNEGFLDMNELDTLLSSYNMMTLYGRKRIKIVALTGASNVLGVFNNISEISKIVHQYGARLLVDGAQMVAHRKIDIENFGIDYFTFSAHKVYAPFGTGVIIARKGLLNFCSEELIQIQSSGEENIVGIAALGKAMVLLQRIGMDLIAEEEQVLTRRILQGLQKISGISIYGIKNTDSPMFSLKGGVIVFGIKGLMSDKVAKKLAEIRGIGVRYGCHCAHIIVKHLLSVKPGLERFQRIIISLFPRLKLPGLVRVSLGIENTEDEVDTLIRVVGIIAGKHVLKENAVKQQMDDFLETATQRVYDIS